MQYLNYQYLKLLQLCYQRKKYLVDRVTEQYKGQALWNLVQTKDNNSN